MSELLVERLRNGGQLDLADMAEAAKRKTALYRRALVLACEGDSDRVAYFVSEASHWTPAEIAHEESLAAEQAQDMQRRAEDDERALDPDDEPSYGAQASDPPTGTPSNAPGAWTCSRCGFRGFWSGGPHECASGVRTE